MMIMKVSRLAEDDNVNWPSAYPRATSSGDQALPCLSCWYTQPLCWHVDRGEYEQEAHNQID